MSNLFKKNNVPYLIASSLATLTLISSLVFAVTSSVPLLLILALVSVSVIALSCRAIGNNKKMEVEKNKFTQKGQELENKITLEREAEEDANKKVERLSNKLNKLTEEKRGLESKVERLNGEIDRLKIQLESQEPYDESEEKGGDENEELEEKITKEIEILRSHLTSGNHRQDKEHLSKTSRVDKAFLDKFQEIKEKLNEHTNNLEGMLNTLEQNLLPGSATQEIANSLEVIIKDLNSEHSSQMEEDPGYTSRCTTPVSQLCDPMVECVHRTKMGSTVFLR